MISEVQLNEARLAAAKVRLDNQAEEYEARIAAYELEIKELKDLKAFSYMDLATEVERRRMVILAAGVGGPGPPPGSTLLSESQHTLAARIGRGEAQEQGPS